MRPARTAIALGALGLALRAAPVLHGTPALALELVACALLLGGALRAALAATPRPRQLALDVPTGALVLLAAGLAHGGVQASGIARVAAAAALLSLAATTLCQLPRSDRRRLALVGALVVAALGELAATAGLTAGGPPAWLLLPAAALAAWAVLREARDELEEHEEAQAPGREEQAVLAVAGIGAIALLGAGTALPQGAPVTAALATGALVLAGIRVALGLAEARALADSRRLAEVDELSGLLNRRGLLARLAEELDAAERAGGACSLLLMDLDRFKEVNDTLGHQAGDRLLVEVTRRLREALPDAVLGRLGGDEFVAVVRGEQLAALGAAERIRVALDPPVELGGTSAQTQASVGIASAPIHARHASDLLRHADAAMYRAKQRGTRAELHVPSEDGEARRRMALDAEVRGALADPEQLELLYEPQLEVATGRIVGVEAEVRWAHPTRGRLAADELLASAVRQGLGHAVTLLVLDRALAQRRAWARVGLDLRVAVDVRASDLVQPTFADAVAARLAAVEAPGEALVLELTEDAAMRDSDRAAATLARLAELGVAVALDDFGTGASSLARLRRMAVGELKVSRGFLRGLGEGGDDDVLVGTMVELGRSLGLRTTALGVERPEQLELLAGLGCGVVQGPYVSRPRSAARMTLWLLDRLAGPTTPTSRPTDG